MQLSIASHLRYLIKYSVVFITVVHAYFYIVVDTQRGCHTLKLYPHIVFTINLRIYFHFRCKVHTYLVKQTKIIFLQQKRKQPSLPSRNNNLCLYQLTTQYTTSLTQLCYWPASVSHPIPLSAANHFLVQISLQVTPPTYHQQFLNVRWLFKFITDGYEPPVT